MNRKIILVLLIQFTISSCSSKYAPITAFLETKHKKNESVIIIKEKADISNALRIFYGGDKSMEIQKSSRSKFFDQKDYETMYSQYSKDTIKKYWQPKDFPDFDFIFENRLGMWNTKFLDKYEHKPALIFSISEPIFYRNKEYVMFYFSRGSTGDIQGLTHESKTIIMRKINGKWEIADQVSDYIYH
ncbi:hypothetical protein AAFH68_36270 [Flavobacterium sp. CGRL1]|jgi:hypothetical protein